jgi:hypothetical protein
VAVHLGQRPDVDEAAEVRHRPVELDEERVAAAARDRGGSDRAAGLDRDHRDRAQAPEDLRQGVPLVPAEKVVPDRGALSGQAREAGRVAGDAELRARDLLAAGRADRAGGDDENADERQEPPHDRTMMRLYAHRVQLAL